MQISSALLRSLSSKGWDKPLNTLHWPSNATANEPQVCSHQSVAFPDEALPDASMAALKPRGAGRSNAKAPQHSNQFVKVSTTPLRDRRLSSTAKCLLLMVKALAGNANSIDMITKGQLAGVIGRSRRTVQYALHELEALGYLALKTVKGHFGLYAGLQITIGMFTKPFSPTEFYQKTADQGQKSVKPAFSDRQVAALQITRFKYLEKKAGEMRLKGWLLNTKTG